MSRRPSFMAVVFLALSLLVAAPIAASAQDAPVRVSERLRHKDRLSAVDLPANTVAAEFPVGSEAEAPVRVRTARATADRAARELQAPVNPPSAPDPVSQETMDLIAVALGGGGGGGGERGARMPGQPVFGPVEFSVRRMGVNEKGNPDVALSYDLDPSVPATKFNKNSPGAMTVRLKVEEGTTYIVDFFVKSSGNGTYRVETSGGSRDFVDDQGQLEHVLVVLEATASGWTEIKFGRTGDSMHWVLEVRVNRIEMA